MRRWIEHLITLPAAREDFFDYLDKIQRNLIKSIIEAARTGDTARIAALSIELGVYTKLQEAFTAEVNELKQKQNKEEKLNVKSSN